MAVAFDAFSAAAGHTDNPVTGVVESWSHTCTGSNLVLLVGVAIGVQAGSGATPSNDSTTITVTYNSVAMTDAGPVQVHANGGTSGFIQLFYLVAPATGANTVAVTSTGYNGGSAFFTSTAGAMSFTGADQVNPLRNVDSTIGLSTSASNTVTAGSTSEFVFDFVGCGSNLGVHNQTSRWTDNQSAASQCGNSGGATAAGSASSVTMTRTVTSDSWANIAGAIQPAGAAASASTQIVPVFGAGSQGPLGWQWRQIVGVSAPVGGDLSVNAEVATAVAAALAGTVSIAPQAPSATTTAAAPAASISLKVNAGLAAAVGAAQTATVSEKVNAGVATATGAAFDAVIVSAVNVNAEAATATGAALQPTISFKLNAPTATATGAAQAPTGSLKPSAGVAAVTGAAGAPTVWEQVLAPTATAVGAALQPTISTSSNLNVNAELTTATGAALAPSLSFKLNAPTATGVGAARTPTINPGAVAGLAAAGAAALQPSKSFALFPATAVATGVATPAVFFGGLFATDTIYAPVYNERRYADTYDDVRYAATYQDRTYADTYDDVRYAATYQDRTHAEPYQGGGP